jgi:hypothetical protein
LNRRDAENAEKSKNDNRTAGAQRKAEAELNGRDAERYNHNITSTTGLPNASQEKPHGLFIPPEFIVLWSPGFLPLSASLRFVMLFVVLAVLAVRD